MSYWWMESINHNSELLFLRDERDRLQAELEEAERKYAEALRRAYDDALQRNGMGKKV